MVSAQVKNSIEIQQLNEFSVLLRKKSYIKANLTHSTANAAKPLIYFASLFGMKLVRYRKTVIYRVNWRSKLYCILTIATIVSLLIFIRPISWKYTQTDLPLNILTKTYTYLALVEVIYFIFIASFGNSSLYVKLFHKLDDLNTHFSVSNRKYLKLRFISVVLIVIPILLVTGTFLLTKFSIYNIGQHFTYFLIILHGIVITFLIVQIYINLLTLKILLKHKIRTVLPSSKQFIFKESLFDKALMMMLVDSNIIHRKMNSHYCWFELMQIYDKIADCIYLFNKIYAGQVFITFNTWFVCTLLTICRSLSPSVKYSEVFVNDIFMYSTINARPIFLAKMCQMFITGRDKILKLLLHYSVHNIDEMYADQVQTMIELVQARKIEVSANVFTANVSTVMEFAGRSISYTVLMIQYFYLRVFEQ